MELKHHGIMGQKWGVRNGPPYPLGGGDYSAIEKTFKHKRKKGYNVDYNKKHFDRVLKKDKDTLSTLSYDKDRLKGVDMFYATHTRLDKHQYNALFNKPVPEGGKNVLKYKINAKLKNDIKVASEDSSIDVFLDLYKKDRDFYNFVNDDARMENYFVKEKYGFKAYREARNALHRMDDSSYKPSQDDLSKVYRLFNYVIPYDGAGDKRNAKDVYNQRNKFFNELKKRGYGAVLDTNDALYGRFKAEDPVIVFDMSQVIPQEAYRTDMKHKNASILITTGRKILGA